MQWKKILKIVGIAVAIYIVFVAIEFVVLSNSMRKVTYSKVEPDSATKAQVAIIQADIKRYTQDSLKRAKDSLKLADSSAKR